MKKESLFYLFLFIVSLSLVSATNTYQIDNNLSINHPVRVNGYPVATALCNITVINPIGNVIVDFQQMTGGTATHNYTVTQDLNDKVGLYDYFITCSSNGLNQTDSFQYEITYTGKENPGTGFIVVYSLIFVTMFAFIVYFFLHGIAKGGKFEFDVKDLSFSWGFMFALLAMYLVFNIYWADATIGSILVWLIGIVTITNGLVPLVLFIVSIMFGSIKTNKPYEMFGRKKR